MSTGTEGGRRKRVWIDDRREIAAGADELRALIRDVDAWPSWTPGLLALRRRRKGPVQVGEWFVLVLEAPGIRRIVLPCKWIADDGNRFVWGGGAFGGVIEHSFELTSLASDRTELRHLEFATSWFDVITRPVEKYIYEHDLGWSEAMQNRYRA